MIRIKLFSTFFIFTIFLIVGCFENREILFEEQKLGWEPPDKATNELNTVVDIGADESDSRIATLRMQYAGEHQAQDLTGTFVIGEETDAVEGTHFNIINDQKQVTIAANSSYSEEIEIEILSENISNGAQYTIFLVITEDGDLEPMENYKEFALFIEKGT